MVDRITIQSLRMEDFGCHRDETVRFEPGLNQLLGPNESGKSTILRAIFDALFEDGTTRKQSVLVHRNWMHNRPFRLTLVFSVGQKEFMLLRDYASGNDLLTDSDGARYEGKALTEKLRSYFGTTSCQLYEAIYCFSSDFPTSIEKQKERLKALLETPVFSGFDRVRADQYLDAEIKELDNPHAHNTTQLEQVNNQISGKLQEKSALEERLRILNLHKKELVEAQVGLKQYDGEVEQLEREIGGAEAYRQINERMINLEERLHTHLTNYSRAAQVAEDLVRIDTEMNRQAVPVPEEFDALILNRDVMAGQVDESKRMMDTLIVKRGGANWRFILVTVILVGLCLTHLALQMLNWDHNLFGNILLFCIPPATVLWFGRIWSYHVISKEKAKATELFRKAVAALDSFYAEINTRCGLNAADPLKALDEFNQRRERLLINADNLRRTIDYLSEGKGLEYLSTVKSQLETEVAQLNTGLAPLVPYAAASCKIPELKEKLTAARVRANAYREQAALLTERCSAIDTLQGQITVCEQELEAIKRRHIEITEQIEVFKITRIALNRAADRLIEETFAAFSATSSTVLELLTQGRYKDVRFTNETAHFEIKESESDRWMEISDLFSSSTRDAFYLAMRVAAAAYLSDRFVPPVIFDQAELRMDSSRREQFYNLLARLAGSRQVIYVGTDIVENLPSSHFIRMNSNRIGKETVSAP